tara:strand:+ start:297 stop:785 length:489 start_codon:yes stop_codon:yes gene_type:complete
MGYGYGVWLLVKDSKIQKIVDQNNTKPHLAHITVMCNMSDTDAFKLSKQLNDNYKVTVLNRHVNLNGNGHKYSEYDDNQLYASGYYCVVDRWREITEIAKYYKGSIPLRPHLSIAYKAVEKDLPKNITGEIIITDGCVGAININSSDPSEWYYINQTKPTTG